ncbi:MAG: hypothetical protein WBF89_05775 [Steroidobacteraceae bacterium]
MRRPGAVFPVHPEAPAAIESRALGTLDYIRASIESSSSMDVPGMAGIVMGSIGLLAAILVSLPRWASHWLSIWLAAAALAFVLGGALVARQIASRGHSRYLGPARKFLLCLCPALLAGAVLTLVLESDGMRGVIPGMWLLLYGCAVLSASTVTAAGIARLVGAMGALFVALGSITFALPAAAHSAMLGLGFGVLHILFGILIGRTTHGS